MKYPVIEDREALERLVLKAQKGDTSAFEILFQTFYTPLYRYLSARTRKTDDVTDLVAQTFLQFYEALPRYEEGSIKSYLFTVARRLLINHTEKKAFQPLPEDFDISDENINLEEEIDAGFLKEHLISLLEYVSPQEKEVVLMFFFAELSYEEISTTLNIPEATVRKIKSRALAKLRKEAHHLQHYANRPQ